MNATEPSTDPSTDPSPIHPDPETRAREGRAFLIVSFASLLLAMQARVHSYVIAGEGTAQEALDGLVEDWTEVFEDEGKL